MVMVFNATFNNISIILLNKYKYIECIVTQLNNAITHIFIPRHGKLYTIMYRQSSLALKFISYEQAPIPQ